MKPTPRLSAFRALSPFLVAAALIAACGSPRIASVPPPPPAVVPPERIPIDPETSPLPFRWLGEESVLVDPDAGQRSLATFGNFIGRQAQPMRRARLSVWDDEDAWRRSLGSEAPSDQVLAHKRAEYLKETEPAPVEQFTVFDREGQVVYERDFRDWPLTETDEP